MNDLLDYTESEARNNAEFHIACAETLMRESNTLLTLLLGGAGGALALLAALNEKAASLWLQIGVGFASAYLFGVAALLVWKCLYVRPIYPSANEPKNLLMDGFDLVAIRKVELRNKQACIEHNRDRNDSVGKWLNICRGCAALTPLAFSVAAVVAY